MSCPTTCRPWPRWPCPTAASSTRKARCAAAAPHIIDEIVEQTPLDLGQVERPRHAEFLLMHNLFWSLIILFLIATLLRLDWVYYLVYVVGGVWMFSHWRVRRTFRKLRVEREMLTRLCRRDDRRARAFGQPQLAAVALAHD